MKCIWTGIVVVMGWLGSAVAGERPNVVLILADDLGYGDVGFHGCEDIETPNLDALAASGVRFSSGYSTHPFCSPMRAALMAGRYQQRFGYETNVAYDPQNVRIGLPVGEVTVADRLRGAGYRTGAIGKWHLGAAHVFHPNKRGFDFWYGFLGGGHQYFETDVRKPLGEGYWSALDRDGTPVAFEGYLTRDLTREAVGFLEREAKGEKPFFLYLAYNAPHGPLQAPEETVARYAAIENKKRRTYAAMVDEMDAGIGEVLVKLSELGLREQTLVFFLSDNGGPERANASDNGLLRGQKGDVWEGGVRVPFVASWPGVLPAGRVYDEAVVSIDISRTACALAGAKQKGMEGVNLVPFLTGEREGVPHEALFWRTEGRAQWGLRVGREKLLWSKGAERVSLYDVGVDAGESRDLAVGRGGRVRELEGLWERWDAENVAPLFPGYREYHDRKKAFYREMEEEGD